MIGRAQKISRQMELEGRVTTLSKQKSFELERGMALSALLKEQARKKERASRAYASFIESGMNQVYRTSTTYQRIINYLLRR
ncbi:MAG: hypothetical protein KC535_06055 [Nanoarchaeota archaeon]|nr:hypothetical protein [Nanoarchaeota archaeon]